MLLKLNLSQTERDYIIENQAKTFFFRNGINIFDTKHASYSYKVFFVTEIDSMYAEFIEKSWREKFGMPRLCSYISGR